MPSGPVLVAIFFTSGSPSRLNSFDFPIELPHTLFCTVTVRGKTLPNEFTSGMPRHLPRSSLMLLTCYDYGLVALLSLPSRAFLLGGRNECAGLLAELCETKKNLFVDSTRWWNLWRVSSSMRAGARRESILVGSSNIRLRFFARNSVLSGSRHL